MTPGTSLLSGAIAGRRLLWGLVVLLVVAGGLLAAWPFYSGRLARPFGLSRTSSQREGSLETLGAYGEVPDFALIERSGRKVAREDLLGGVWIVDFFYTECTDTCPLQSATMARLQADFTEEPDVRLVSISVDPEHDSPAMLAEYAARFRADLERWLFLTGPRETIYHLAVDGFHLDVVDQSKTARRGRDLFRAWPGPASAWAHPVPNPERLPIIHSSRFVLVDRNAQIRGYYLGTEAASLQRLRENVWVVLREKPKPQ